MKVVLTLSITLEVLLVQCGGKSLELSSHASSKLAGGGEVTHEGPRKKNTTGGLLRCVGVCTITMNMKMRPKRTPVFRPASSSMAAILSTNGLHNHDKYSSYNPMLPVYGTNNYFTTTIIHNIGNHHCKCRQNDHLSRSHWSLCS